MLDLKFIRENSDLVRQKVALKGYSADVVDKVLVLDESRRKLLVETETMRAHRNQLTKEDIEEAKQIKTRLSLIEPELEAIEVELKSALNAVPNLPAEDVPVGHGEKDNIEVKKWGTPRDFDFPVKDHLQLGNELGILDFESGSKVAGSQFYYLTGGGAQLELALVRFAFDVISKEGFLPVITPDVAKSKYYLGTGYQPRGDEAQTYTLEDEDLGLIATAEVTLAGRHADEIIPQSKLPIKYIGYSHCFRREAGAYGKYSKGLYRVHQFTKTEMFIFCLPEESVGFHHQILALEEKLFQLLNIPYRVLEMCTGDLGAMAAKKYDVEAWMPGRGDYGEVTSTSNCTDYQARNLNIKYKTTDGSTGFVHMLNGTAIVTSRVPIAILENYQNADGSVTVPEVLRPYLGFDLLKKI